MRRREEQEHNSNSQDAHNMVVSSSSKSSSSSSSPSPSTSILPQTPSRTMEDVWKDIGLSTAAPTLDNNNHRSYYDHSSATCHASMADTNLSHLRGMNLQDFLARPFKGNQPSAPSVRAEEAAHHRDMGPLGSRSTRLPPATILSLNSGVDTQYMDGVAPGSRPPSFPNAQSHTHSQQHHGTSTGHGHPSCSSSITAAGFSDTPASPCPGIFSFCSNKKRAPEEQQLESPDGAGGDRRHKRMIKNRESAARSRARKQAYTNELELEVNHLTEENEKLRTQHEELRAKMAAQLSTKKALQRSSTAPF